MDLNERDLKGLREIADKHGIDPHESFGYETFVDAGGTGILLKPGTRRIKVYETGTQSVGATRYDWKGAEVTEFEPPRDQTVPEGKWAFDQGVTDVFDDMLARSIPAYDTMRDACNRLAIPVLKQEPCRVLDLGCSRGGAIADLLPHAGEDALFLGLEVSEPMLGAATARFGHDKRVSIQKYDMVRDPRGLDFNPSLILCVLSVMFTPIEHRLRLLSRLHDLMQPGGMLIFVEKLIGGSARLDQTMTDAYLQLKRDQGYTEEEIQRKKCSLEGVLVPMTATWNEELLRLVGFRDVDCFWRYLQFGGWVAVKDGNPVDHQLGPRRADVPSMSFGSEYDG